MIEVAKVVELKPLVENRHGSVSPTATKAFGIVLTSWSSGAMSETLRDLALFQRAVLSFGAPTGPNGFDLDPLNVHMEMKERGPLRRSAAA